MTCIAWDGTTLAADKLGDSCGLARTVTKIFRFERGLFASAGMASRGQAMLQWIKAGAIPADIPLFQLTDDYQSVMVVLYTGEVLIYAQTAYPFLMEDPYHAAGSGRDYALAAMHLGRTAEEAVEVACKFDTGCGMGIDVLRLRD